MCSIVYINIFLSQSTWIEISEIWLGVNILTFRALDCRSPACSLKADLGQYFRNYQEFLHLKNKQAADNQIIQHLEIIVILRDHSKLLHLYDSYLLLELDGKRHPCVAHRASWVPLGDGNKAQQGKQHFLATSIRPGRDKNPPNTLFHLRMHWILECSETFSIADMKIKWHSEASSQLTFVRVHKIFISPTPVQSNWKRCWSEFACSGFPRAA